MDFTVDVSLRSMTRDNGSSHPAFVTRSQSTESLSRIERHLAHGELSAHEEAPVQVVAYPPSLSRASLGDTDPLDDEGSPSQVVSLAPMDGGRQAW